MQSTEKHSYELVNKGWPTEAHYTPVSASARSLGVRLQPPALKRTFKNAIRVAVGNAMFDCAYPPVDNDKANAYYRDILYKVAKSSGHRDLSKRFQNDDELVMLASSVVRTPSFNLFPPIISPFFPDRSMLVFPRSVHARNGPQIARWKVSISCYLEMLPGIGSKNLRIRLIIFTH